MIEGITGKVGGGKSLLAVSRMLDRFMAGQACVSNIELDPDGVARYLWKRKRRFHAKQFVQLDRSEVGEFHRHILRGIKGANVSIFIDEAHLVFPASEYRKLSEQFGEVESFVSQSRKLHTDIWLITQAWENVWGQLRRQALFMTECRDMRVINFPIFGKALGGMLGLTWSRRDAASGQTLESGSTRIAPDLCECYSTTQVYDDLMAELLRVTPEFQPLSNKVGILDRLRQRGPVLALRDAPLAPAESPALGPEDPCLEC